MNNCRTYLAAGALAACGLAALLYWGLSASGLPVFSVAEFLAHSNGAAMVVRADRNATTPDLAAQAKRKAAQAKERLKAARAADAAKATRGGNNAAQAADGENNADRTAPGGGPLIASPLWAEANICPSCRVLNKRKRNGGDGAARKTAPEPGGSSPQNREDAGPVGVLTGQTGIAPPETVQIYGRVIRVEGGPGCGSWSDRLSDQPDAPAAASAPAPAVGDRADAPNAPAAPNAATPPAAPAPLFRLILADRDNPEQRMWVAVAPAAGLQARPQAGQEVFVTGALNPVSGIFEARELITVCPARYQTAPDAALPPDAPTAPADGEPPASP